MNGTLILTLGLCVLVLAILSSLALSLSRLRLELPPSSPETFLAAHGAPGRPDGTAVRERPLVVCAGDSLTHGAVSADWVGMLRKRMPDAEFVNAGVNSELAWNLHKRLDPIVALDPDFVTILIGTNDVNATFGFRASLPYLTLQKLPERPTAPFYREMLTLIVRRLKADTRARLALVSLPPIGEDPGHYAFLRSEEYSAIVRELARAEGTAYLPLRERMLAYLEGLPKTQSLRFEDFSRAGQGALWSHAMLGKSWDEIGAANGFHLLVDGLHLNTHAAAMMADLAEGFIRDGRTAARAQAPGGTA